MKILFTSVGRRVELMQAFKAASTKLDINLEIYGADITDDAPALFYCDKKVIVPKIKTEEYIPALLAICQEENIDALIPTIDTDLQVLAENKNKFIEIGTTVIVSDPEKIKICRDKRLTAQYFESVGLNTPQTCDDVSKYNFGFPAFIKPKDGSSSISAFKVNSKEELEALSLIVSDYIIQNFIAGTEYTVDILCDFDGNPIYITPRIRLAVRSGEVLKTQIAQDQTIIKECKQLLADYKPCGPITIQLIREKDTAKDFYVEINPRFGGGAPLSMYAGANSAEAVLRMVEGQKLSYIENAAEDGAVYSRFDQALRVK